MSYMGESQSLALEMDATLAVCLCRSLYIYIPGGCRVTGLKLVIRGHELCEYDYQYVLQQESLCTKIGQRKSRKDLLRVELKIADLSG